jgi:Zn-finger nucleic acid-binding protein
MKCPRGDVALLMSERQGIEIDGCPQESMFPDGHPELGE